MRFLLINNHCVTDPTAGVTRFQWTVAKWLVEAGHACHVLTTSRFEYQVPFTLSDHFAGLGVTVRWEEGRRGGRPAPCRVGRFQRAGVHVTIQVTRHHNEAIPDRAEADQYVRLVQRELDRSNPDVLIACNGHAMIRSAMHEAQRRGVIAVFTVRGYGYDRREWFEDVDHVFTCSEYLSRVLFRNTGIPSTALSSPIDEADVLAPRGNRRFLTFVNPSPNKGALWFARLAQRLGETRPDIPVMVVQSGISAALLNSVPGIDFTRYPQIVAAPATPRPADFLALTHVLLVPSVWEEPFGRVAAEAMLNGIPPLVSNRGGLPEVLHGDFSHGGGGRVLPIPADFLAQTTKLPTDDETQPWYDAVTQLWDDPALYQRMSDRAREIARQNYGHGPQKKAHVDYLTGLLKPPATLPHR